VQQNKHSHGSCPFVKIKFKDFKGPYEGYIRRTKLTQTGTFISIYKQVQFTLDNLTRPSINQKLELSEKFTVTVVMKSTHHSDSGNNYKDGQLLM